MIYCKKCILPDTRPGIILGKNGICNACNNSIDKMENINWKRREHLFKSVVKYALENNKGYDCLIPVSGGKDSTWQVIKCLEYGLNPLAVTWKTPARTKIGQDNLDNLINLGVDHIDYQVNPKVEKKFMLKSLERFGATAIPMHMGLFNIPLNIACKFGIPLVVWGENSAFEYGTDEESLKGYNLNSKWLKKFGVTHGTTAKDWVDDDLKEKDLTPYFGPSDKEIKSKGIKVIFLGSYFKWDTEISLKVALKNGFKVDKKGPRTGFYDYADIDDDFISIHHFLKWYKFGITRIFDNLSIEIRNGRISRNKAIKIIEEKGDQTPYNDIEKFCKFVGISEKKFFKIIEKFRNKNIWIKKNEKWTIKNFLITNWRWV